MRKVGLIRGTLIGVVLAASISVYAQDKPPKTNTIEHNPQVDIKKEAPKVKKPLEIIKNDTQGILYGNKCFEEFTRSRGYIYIVQPQPNPTFKAKLKKFFHNFGVKFIITLKRSIFWKSVEKKKVKDCRLKTGDRVG